MLLPGENGNWDRCRTLRSTTLATPLPARQQSMLALLVEQTNSARPSEWREWLHINKTPLPTRAPRLNGMAIMGACSESAQGEARSAERSMLWTLAAAVAVAGRGLQRRTQKGIPSSLPSRTSDNCYQWHRADTAKHAVESRKERGGEVCEGSDSAWEGEGPSDATPDMESCVLSGHQH